MRRRLPKGVVPIRLPGTLLSSDLETLRTNLRPEDRRIRRERFRLSADRGSGKWRSGKWKSKLKGAGARRTAPGPTFYLFHFPLSTFHFPLSTSGVVPIRTP